MLKRNCALFALSVAQNNYICGLKSFVSPMKESQTLYSQDLQAAVEALRRGQTILYVTDTVWGIGCDAANDAAVQRVYDIKRREDSKSLITLVADVDMLTAVSGPLDKAVVGLATGSVRPTTVIYAGAKGLSRRVVAGDGSAAVRVVKDGFAHDLCKAFGAPVVSTSANVSGNATPGNFEQIDPEIKRSVDYVCMTGRDGSASVQPSRIVVFDGHEIKVIRP